MANSGFSNTTELYVLGTSAPKIKQNYGLKTHYFGTNRDDLSLALLYSAADVFVAPSIEENFSATVFESLSCGTPVVAFNIGGMPDMILHEKNGYLVSTKLLKRYFGICSDVSTRRGPRSNHSKRTYLIRLLQGRQWENLFKPYSLYSFIKIYADNPKKSFFTKFYKIIVSKVRNAFRRILCLCSFGMIYHYGFLSSILSMIFIRKFDTYGHYYYCFFIGTSTIFIYVYDINYTYASIISELIPLLLFNNIGKNLIKNLNKKLIFYVKKYIIVGLYQLDVIFLLCFSIIISYDVTINIYVIILILFLITVIQIFRKLDLFIISITLSVVLIFGRISSYSIFHCIILPVIVSFYYNIFIINLDEKSDFAKSYIALYHDRKDMIRNYF